MDADRSESDDVPALLDVEDRPVSPLPEAAPVTSRVSRGTSESGRSCWVCFATEEDDRSAVWLRPCRCHGSSQWVHEQCLQRWVDEKQKGDSLATVNCAQCATAYLIIYPGLNALLALLERIDRNLNRICPLLTGGIILGSVYWSAVTFGAITVMQVMEYKAAMRALEQADYMLLLIGLPTIPILLIVGRMIRWEEAVVQSIYRHFHASPARVDRAPPLRDPASATRTVCGALALPTIAALVGRTLFGRLGFSPFKRTLLGCACFLTVKGMFKVYYKYSQMVRKSGRRIEDFNEDETEERPLGN